MEAMSTIGPGHGSQHKCPQCGKEYILHVYELAGRGVAVREPQCQCAQQAEALRRELRAQERVQTVLRDLEREAGPRPWREATFEGFTETTSNAEMLRAVGEYRADGHPRCLVLVGPSGCGKTRLALATARREVERLGIRAKFLTATEFLRTLRGYFPSEALDLLKQIKTVPLLILDDVQPLADRERIDMLDLIDSRYRTERATIVTTNIRKEDFDSAWGMQISSRLQDSTYSKVAQYNPQEE